MIRRRLPKASRLGTARRWRCDHRLRSRLPHQPRNREDICDRRSSDDRQRRLREPWRAAGALVEQNGVWSAARPTKRMSPSAQSSTAPKLSFSPLVLSRAIPLSGQVGRAGAHPCVIRSIARKISSSARLRETTRGVRIPPSSVWLPIVNPPVFPRECQWCHGVRDAPLYTRDATCAHTLAYSRSNSSR